MRRTERAWISGGGYFPEMDITTGWKADEFGVRIDNYGKTPAFVMHVVIGYWDTKNGSPPKRFPGGKSYDLFYNISPGQQSLETDVKIPRSQIAGDIIFGRFFYEDIFSRRWPVWRKSPAVWIYPADRREQDCLALSGSPHLYRPHLTTESE